MTLLNTQPGHNMNHFDHEKLDVYKISLDFTVIVDEIVSTLPKGRGYLSDQLLRAASSIPLNIAEGAGEFSQNEKSRFYRIAKRSATECSSIIDICNRLKLINESYYSSARNILYRIVSMLIKMVK